MNKKLPSHIQYQKLDCLFYDFIRLYKDKKYTSMSLLNHFSVSYNLNQSNKKKEENRGISYTKDSLTKDIVDPLIEFGYEIEQIMTAFKIYKFTTLDDAIHIMMRDPDSGKYNHTFAPDDKRKGNYHKYSNKCMICAGSKEEHIGNDLNEKEGKLEMEGERKGDKIKPTKNSDEVEISMNNERSQNNLIRNTESSALFEKKPADVTIMVNQKMFAPPSIKIAKETLDFFEEPDICRICFAEKVEDANKAQFACGHKFCKTCVATHLKTNIFDGKVLMIKCLYGGCPKAFTDEEIKNYVDSQTYAKYKKFKTNLIKLNNPSKTYINCPYPDCEELVDCDQGDWEETFVECLLGHKFCYLCKSLGWHKKKKCQNQDMLLLQQIKKGNKNAINYKQCPKCYVIIEKNEGCNQMQCTNCQFEFCWLCMKKYSENHYAIYNVGGCPGMRFDTDSRRKCWSNPCLKCLWLLLSCILGFLAIILILIFFALFGCSYEFVKCYLNRKPDGEDEDSSSNYEYNEPRRQNNNPEPQEEEPKKNWPMICFIAFLGFLCQPFYLIFYILYGLMECYRRFNCWFYYVDY